MTTRTHDLTIDEAMSDPMIRRVMKADRVEPKQLEIMLRSVASSQTPGNAAMVVPSLAMIAARAPRGAMGCCGSFCS